MRPPAAVSRRLVPSIYYYPYVDSPITNAAPRRREYLLRQNQHTQPNGCRCRRVSRETMTGRNNLFFPCRSLLSRVVVGAITTKFDASLFHSATPEAFLNPGNTSLASPSLDPRLLLQNSVVDVFPTIIGSSLRVQDAFLLRHKVTYLYLPPLSLLSMP